MLQMEVLMTIHQHKTEKEQGPDVRNSLFDLFSKNDGFWWPYRSFAKALLSTQKNASAYLEANRKLIDEMRNIVRKERDLALEISEKALGGVAEKDWPNGAMPGASEVNVMFERGASGLRELGEAWMNAQMDSLDAMRSHASGGQRPPATRRHETSLTA